ncbi:MAG TPA: penicillin-binding transpeptidase domain-containing protein [Vicinamibacteria bacterium]|nr:penicillin-binding transpeptidase domain-containing protein [Vicinamibacteria bacterium]
MIGTRDLVRFAAWALVPLAAGAGIVAWLALAASADLGRGRERLLAGDVAGAEAAFDRARRWPATTDAARSGRRAADARAGRAVGEAVPLVRLDALAPEALVLSALAEGRLDAAAAIADLARRAGHPLGALYAAAVAFERGDEAGARARARESRVPLDSRGLGSKLRQALEARDTGAVTLLFDRRGDLAATAGRDGRLRATSEAAPFLAGVLERLGRAPDRPAVRLAIDLGLSRLALDALGSTRGSIVLVEPRTGSVLAAVSDARTAASERAAAFEQRRKPASIAKLLTAAAAYRAGLDADAEIKRMTCTGVGRYGGQALWCAFPAGPLEGLDHALAVSCNLAFANLGVRIGAERLLEEHRLWGFDAGGDAWLGAAGRVHTRPRTPLEVADLSIGLEMADVTPLHAALLAAVVADDGHLHEPRLLLGPCGGLGLTDEPRPPHAGRAATSPAIARRLRKAMQAVAASGTGAGLAPASFPAGMKTGTAAAPGLGYHVNYIGLGPLPEPTVAFCVRVTHERSNPAVTRAARNVTRRLLELLAADRMGLAREGQSGAGGSVQRPSRTWTTGPDRNGTVDHHRVSDQ